jgi:ABC-2 type transport system ATP-binding protein
MKVHEALELFSSFYTRTADPNRILDRLQLSEKKDAFYKSLSGGQKQRVALGLALLNDPTLLFLDEPTTGLDPQVRHEIHGVIQELKENRRTILITTHYIEEAERLCDRVAIVDTGKIIELGTPREIQGRVLGHTLVEIKTDLPMPLENLPEKIQELKHATGENGRMLSVQSGEPAALIVDLVKWIEAENLKLVDIHMKRPTLEDVFIELTGKKLREA